MIDAIQFGAALPHLNRRGDKGRGMVLANRRFEFSRDKVNVLIGPNGSGKTSLLETLAIVTLSFGYGVTDINDDLVRRSDEYWQKEDKDRYWDDGTFMRCVSVESEGLPFTTYVSPDFKPCGALDWAHAMCYGLGAKATTFFESTAEHSSGQGMHNVIGMAAKVLGGKVPTVSREYQKSIKWRSEGDSLQKKAKELYTLIGKPKTMLGIFDEPERCLDMKAQLRFWDEIPALARDNCQIIICTHSVLPFLDRPERFNFVQMENGYAQSVATEINQLVQKPDET